MDRECIMRARRAAKTMTECRDFFVPGPVGKLAARSKGLAPGCDHVVVLVQGANYASGFDLNLPRRKTTR